jgi:hypothetical protein
VTRNHDKEALTLFGIFVAAVGIAVAAGWWL